ncbi:MAG: hypothetical protein KA978_16630, partial [Deltaproteobacteria bacterium]|nr:hypothetical protein [Deltaproteobacteria bacterium]
MQSPAPIALLSALLALSAGCSDAPTMGVDAAQPLDALDASVVDAAVVEKPDVPPDRVRVVPAQWPRTPPAPPSYS